MSDKPKPNQLWGGRFERETHPLMQAFSASLSVDRRLAAQDLRVSRVHARGLARIDLLTADELAAIERGLSEIEDELRRGEDPWPPDSEDIHTAIEALLTEKIGAPGRKLHTARSRNDQVATSMRLFLREQIDLISKPLTALQQALVALASKHAATPMPGYTHMQNAQPVTFGHHMLAWNEMLERDYERLLECRARTNLCPLGAAALAGSSFRPDREYLAQALGFDAPCRNSMDAVSDRDFAIEFAAWAALAMSHLSRMSEELVLWSSPAFGFVDLGDGFCTGSSIMPQKKNPDAAELVRGKSARAAGNLVSLLTLMKAQPLAYNRDNQEDKSAWFDSADTVRDSLALYAEMMPQITLNEAALAAAAAQGYPTATELADYLVTRGQPFRDAHELVGRIVREASDRGCALEALSPADLRGFSELIDEDVYPRLSVEGSIAARDHFGGSAPKRVAAAAAEAAKRLKQRKTPE